MMMGAAGAFAHGYCLLWNGPLVAAHVLGDALIAIAYFLIPVLLFGMRKLFTFEAPRTALLLFGAFIVACGCTHVMDIVVLQYPLYWLQASVKLATAGISMLAGVFLWHTLISAGSVQIRVEQSRIPGVRGWLQRNFGSRAQELSNKDKAIKTAAVAVETAKVAADAKVAAKEAAKEVAKDIKGGKA